MKKLVLKRVIDGMMYGCVMFVCAMVFIDLCLDNSLSVLPHQYTRIAIGGMVVGIGFVMSSLIYDEDRISLLVRGLIQLVICAGALIIGFFISGSISYGTGSGTGTIFFLVEMGFGAIIWIGNFIYFWHEARQIKKKLTERNETEIQ